MGYLRAMYRTPPTKGVRSAAFPSWRSAGAVVLLACLAGCAGDDSGGGDGTGGTGGTADSATDGSCVTPVECAEVAEAAAASAMTSLVQSPDELHNFMVQMPLGGDLHHHLSGSVYAETFLALATELGGFCIDPDQLSLSSSCGGDTVPIPSSDEALYDELIRAWSMYEFVPSPEESGADHFFSTFGKFGAISGTQHGRMLADVRRRAASENVLYIEPMLTANSTARNLGEDEWDALGGGALEESDYAGLHSALLASSGFGAARTRLTGDVTDSEMTANVELECDSAEPGQGCDVVTRYQAYISRSGSDPGVFAQMVAAYEAAMVEPRLVGLNLVGPEDGNDAMANYDRLMAMLAYLNDYYDGMSPLRLSLHAGEITAASIPGGYQLDETQHIRKAVQTAGAQRVGHGIDVMFEGDPEALFDTLANTGVLVEICLASNDIILGVKGAGHPVHDYLERGVPVALATDDQGVARSSLAAEYVRAAADQQLDYRTLKAMARASIEYSFLPGESLWASEGALVAPCMPAEGDTPVTQPPTAECQAFLSGNPRAEVQLELERRLEEFEAEF